MTGPVWFAVHMLRPYMHDFSCSASLVAVAAAYDSSQPGPCLLGTCAASNLRLLTVLSSNDSRCVPCHNTHTVFACAWLNVTQSFSVFALNALTCVMPLACMAMSISSILGAAASHASMSAVTCLMHSFEKVMKLVQGTNLTGVVSLCSVSIAMFDLFLHKVKHTVLPPVQTHSKCE